MFGGGTLDKALPLTGNEKGELGGGEGGAVGFGSVIASEVDAEGSIMGGKAGEVVLVSDGVNQQQSLLMAKKLVSLVRYTQS